MEGHTRRFPSSVCVRITRRCNAACAFCQAPFDSRDEMATEQLCEVFTKLAAHGVRSVKFSGGEPTLRRDLADVLLAVADAGLKPVVITNGLRLRPELLAGCVRSGAELKFSVHRPDAGHDGVLRRPGASVQVRDNMRRAVEAGVRVSVNTVVTAQTYADLAAMAEYARVVGAWKISFIPVVPRGLASGRREFTLDDAGVARVRGDVDRLARASAGVLAVRCIDIRSRDYWVIENNGILWIERATEAADIRLGDIRELTAPALVP